MKHCSVIFISESDSLFLLWFTMVIWKRFNTGHNLNLITRPKLPSNRRQRWCYLVNDQRRSSINEIMTLTTVTVRFDDIKTVAVLILIDRMN